MRAWCGILTPRKTQAKKVIHGSAFPWKFRSGLGQLNPPKIRNLIRKMMGEPMSCMRVAQHEGASYTAPGTPGMWQPMHSNGHRGTTILLTTKHCMQLGNER